MYARIAWPASNSRRSQIWPISSRNRTTCCSSVSSSARAAEDVDQRLPLLGAAVQPLERDERRPRSTGRTPAPAGRRGSRRRRPASAARGARRAGCRGRSSWPCRSRRRRAAAASRSARSSCRACAADPAIAASAPVCAGSMRSACCTEWIAYSRWLRCSPYQRPIFTHRSAAALRSSRLELVDAVRVLVEQLLPAVGRRGEPLELARGVLVRVVALERGLQHVERGLLVADLALVDLADLVEQADLRLDVRAQLARSSRTSTSSVHLYCCAIDRLEAVRRRHVRRVRRAHALVDLPRRVSGPRPSPPTSRRPGAASRGAAPRRRGRARASRARRSHSSQRPSRVNSCSSAASARKSLGSIAITLAPGIDRLVDPAEHVALELTELGVQLDRLGLVDRAGQMPRRR